MKNSVIVLFKGFQKVGEFETLEAAKNSIQNSSGEFKSIWNILFCEKENGKFKVLARTSVRS